MNKNKTIATLTVGILLILSLSSVNSNAEIIELEINQCPDISGNWTLNHYNWEGNLTSSESVNIVVNESNVTIYAGAIILTKGNIFSVSPDGSGNATQYIINCSDFRNLGVNNIFIYNEFFMITELPMCESCNPSEFFRGNITSGVNVTCEDDEKNIFINQTAEYEIVIKNTGKIKDTYNITIPDALPLCCFYVSLSDLQVTLLPNKSASVFLRITPYDYFGFLSLRVRAASVRNETVMENVTTTTLVMLDTVPPEVSIARPVNAIYFFNTEISKFFIKPIIIGDIQIWFNAYDNQSGLRLIEIYINDELRDSFQTVPKSWVWSQSEHETHRYTIKIVAYDNNAWSASAEIDVIRFL